MTQATHTDSVKYKFYEFSFELPAEVLIQEIQFQRPFYAVKTLGDVILLRACHKCQQLLPLTEFYGRKAPCKSCHKELVIDWQKRHPELVKAYKKIGNRRYRYRQKLKDADLE